MEQVDNLSKKHPNHTISNLFSTNSSNNINICFTFCRVFGFDHDRVEICLAMWVFVQVFTICTFLIRFWKTFNDTSF